MKTTISLFGRPVRARFTAVGILLLLLASRSFLDAAPAKAPAADPRAVFEQLKSLAGEWSGHVGKPDGPAASVSHRVTAAGHTVMETLFPGTNHEMISMYHLDGNDLVLTHYCSAGNQPRMKLNRRKSSAAEWVFDFVSGGNMKSAKDGHIHGGRLRLENARKLEAEWTFYQDGKAVDAKKFLLDRATTR